MTAATGFEAWIGYVSTKKVDFSADTFTLFLTNTAPDAAADAVLADITEVSYANCSSRNLVLASRGDIRSARRGCRGSRRRSGTRTTGSCAAAVGSGR